MVAAVIPTRNRSTAAARAVASVRAQTRPVAEVVVVDDASDPEHRRALAALATPGVRVERSDVRIRGAAARNRGVGASTSPLLAFLDDDDVWEPDKVARQAALFAAPEVAWSWTAYRIVDPETAALMDEVRPRQADFASLLRRSALACSTLMVRREAFAAIGGFDETLPRNQDWDLFLRLARDHRGAYLDQPLTVMNRSVPDARACIDGRHRLLDKWRDAVDALPAAARRAVLAEHHGLLWGNYAQLGDLAAERYHAVRALALNPWAARHYRGLLLTVLHHLGWRGRFAGRG